MRGVVVVCEEFGCLFIIVLSVLLPKCCNNLISVKVLCSLISGCPLTPLIKLDLLAEAIKREISAWHL